VIVVPQMRAISLDGVCLRGKCGVAHGLGYNLLARFAPIIAKRITATRLQ